MFSRFLREGARTGNTSRTHLRAPAAFKGEINARPHLLTAASQTALWACPADMGNCMGFSNSCDRPRNTNIRWSLPAVCFVWQLSMIILFGVFVRYNEESDSHWADYRKEKNITSDIENDYYYRYPSRCTNLFSYFNSCLLNVVFILICLLFIQIVWLLFAL